MRHTKLGKPKLLYSEGEAQRSADPCARVGVPWDREWTPGLRSAGPRSRPGSPGNETSRRPTYSVIQGVQPARPRGQVRTVKLPLKTEKTISEAAHTIKTLTVGKAALENGFVLGKDFLPSKKKNFVDDPRPSLIHTSPGQRGKKKRMHPCVHLTSHHSRGTRGAGAQRQCLGRAPRCPPGPVT